MRLRIGLPVWGTVTAWLVCSGVLLSAAGNLAWGVPPSFTEVSAAAGLGGNNHSPTYSHSFPSGGAVGDFDRDGYQDIFFPGGGGQPDKLFINNGNGTFSDRSVAWGVSSSHQSTGAAVADYDGDGWLDLFVSSYNSNRLYRNQGGTAFLNVATAAGVATPSPFGGAFGDYDLDGDLDLAVATFDTDSANRFYRNNGNGTFTDVTTASGVAAGVAGITGFTVRMCDMNGDRYPELLWIGDFGSTRYLRNNGNGTFTNITGPAGVGHDGTEMGHTVADFDRDGDFDWYVTTINTNNLYRNNGNHSYTQIANQAGAVSTGWGWGTVAVDFDHDMLIDIAATSQSAMQYLYRNTSAALPTLSFFFTPAGFTSSNSGRGLANLDYDNDGDQDLVLFNYNGPIQLFRNNVAGAADAHWLRVVLEDGGVADIPADGIGAVIRVTAGGVVQTGRIDAGSNYQSQSELTAHFGLGTETVATNVTVEWPNGDISVLANVPADQTLVIRPGRPFLRGDVNDDAMVNVSDIGVSAQAVFGLSAPKCFRATDMNGDARVDISDVVYLAAHLFVGGPPPPLPYPACGLGNGVGSALECMDSDCP